MSIRLSVRLSVTKTPQLLRIMSICHYAYILISKMLYLISQISQISDLILIFKILFDLTDLSDLYPLVRHQNPQPLRIMSIMSICHYAYILIPKMFYLISQIFDLDL